MRDDRQAAAERLRARAKIKAPKGERAKRLERPGDHEGSEVPGSLQEQLEAAFSAEQRAKIAEVEEALGPLTLVSVERGKGETRQQGP